MKNGRAIGNRFENECCIELTRIVYGAEAVTPTMAHLPFRRRSTSIVPTEGHWEGEGDIMSRPDRPFPYAVECKKDEKFTLDGLLTQSKPTLRAHIQQASEQGARADLPWLLILGRARFPKLLVLETKNYFQRDGGQIDTQIICQTTSPPVTIWVDNKPRSFYILQDVQTLRWAHARGTS